MDTYDVELERAEGRFIGTVRGVPGLLVFGKTVDEVLERAQSAIEFRAGSGRTRVRSNEGTASAYDAAKHVVLTCTLALKGTDHREGP